MQSRLQLWFILLVLLSLQVVYCPGADTDAVTFPPSGVKQAVGYLNGGTGWSFVPGTNLVVTWVGYKNAYTPDGGITGLRITFWSGTNAPIASYLSDDLAASQERDTNRMVYGKVSPLLLTAGTQYIITTDLGTNLQIVEVFTSDLSSEDPHFAVASDLTYGGVYDYDANSGSLRSRPLTTSGLVLGPSFRYQLASLFLPRLNVACVGNSVVLTWPTNVAGCVVETSISVITPNWEQVTNAPPPTVIEDRYLFTYSPPDSQPRFFRLRLQ